MTTNYEEMSEKTSRPRLTLWILVLATIIFALTLITVGLVERELNNNNEQQSSDSHLYIISRLWNRFRAENFNRTSDEDSATVERIARDTNVTQNNKNYYEEQRAVVVNAERSVQPELAQRQDSFGPPIGGGDDSYEQGPSYDDYGMQRDQGYYDGGQLSAESSAEQWPEGRAAAGDEGRAAAPSYDTYYQHQWHYATRPPSRNPTPNTSDNRKLQAAPADANRVPYPSYDDVYDYPMGNYRPPQPQAKPPSTAVAANESNESTLVTVLKTLKQMWDLYQALTSAWNSVHERHQVNAEQLKTERIEKQKLRQQQQQQQQQATRVNSKKPPRINGDRKKPRGSTTTKTPTSLPTSTTVSSSTSSESTDTSSEEAPPAKVEPRKSPKGDTEAREKRAATDSTDVGEGRYIKGDPLNGYYDFVITEGSYKFWAVFQVGTALLIIYSTFAAIYYSKVNPLTSDYDYQDYLGAGRSLTDGDADFVDDGDASTTPTQKSGVSDWLPRTAHSLKFILDAIDKFPLDHSSSSEPGWSTGKEKLPAKMR